MSCRICNTKYSVFRRESGCENCGLSFCSKCVKQKCVIPRKGSEEHNVCKKCFVKLTSGPSTSQSTSRPPPDTYLKRLENLENPAAPPITVYKNDPKIQALRTGLSPADQVIVDRLEKLKEADHSPPSETEIRRRLAVLKGQNEYVEGPSRPLVTVDTRTDQQKADSLMNMLINEREIEMTHSRQLEIEARLASLREQGVRPNEGPYIRNLHDSSSSEEDEVDKITRKIMHEVALEDRTKDVKSVTPSSSNDEEKLREFPELPWCVLCNNNAIYRCYGCSGELYCKDCLDYVHKTWTEDADHKVVPYRPK